MPKIIVHLRERLIAEARKQVLSQGYSALTIRGVANAVGVGVGTVYNYFPSKELLIASFMVEDWQAALSEMLSAAASDDARSILLSEYDGVRHFWEQHAALFSDPAAIKTFSNLPRERHLQLREQLAAPVEQALSRSGRKNAAFTADFLVEALLTWTVAGIEKDALFAVLNPLL